MLIGVPSARVARIGALLLGSARNFGALLVAIPLEGMAESLRLCCSAAP
ncbi:MAG: hypothetical protein ACK4P1_08305 [Aggregatilineales bacterium]